MRKKDYTNILAVAKKKTLEYNKRVGERIRIFREIKGITQVQLGEMLGYKSKGTISLIEAGARGLNKVTLRFVANILGTYPEALNGDQALSKEEILDMNKFLQIRKNPKHPNHAALMELLNKSR